MKMERGRFAVAPKDALEAAYEETARKFGLLKPNERISLDPSAQAIVWIPDEPNPREVAGDLTELG
jgi:hypothetical protein